MIISILSVLLILLTFAYGMGLFKRPVRKGPKIGDLPRKKRRHIYRSLNVPSFSQTVRKHVAVQKYR